MGGLRSQKRAGRRKGLAILCLSVAALLLLVLVNFIPTFYMKNPGMNTLEGEYITVYYEKEETAARDVFSLTESESGRIAKKLGFTSPQDIKLYIYDKQSTMQMRKYGLVVLFLNLDWYIGDNRGTNVLLTSPANPGNAHDYDEVKTASVHEMAHAYNSLLNPRMPLWMNEGIAGYLAGQKPREDLYDTAYFVPDIEQTHTNSPLEFSDVGGYDFAYTYVEYIDEAFGWDSLLTYTKAGDFSIAFGMDEQRVYDGWVGFLKENYTRIED
jgi:hypothetical protein